MEILLLILSKPAMWSPRHQNHLIYLWTLTKKKKGRKEGRKDVSNGFNVNKMQRKQKTKIKGWTKWTDQWTGHKAEFNLGCEILNKAFSVWLYNLSTWISERKGMDAPVQQQPQILFAIFSVGKQKKLRIAWRHGLLFLSWIVHAIINKSEISVK